MNKEIAERIKVNPYKELPCAVAHYIAADLGVTPLEVGQTANEIDVRGSMCQLGLFGYAKKGRPAARPRRPTRWTIRASRWATPSRRWGSR